MLIDYSKDELSKSINWMLDHKETLSTMGKAGKRYIQKEWSYESIVTKMTNVYDSIDGENSF